MNPYKEYISKIEGEKYPFYDIENIVITDVKEMGNGDFDVSYDFSVVSRIDNKWSLRRRDKVTINLMKIRNERINQILEMFNFFKKKEKEYKDVKFDIFRYRTPQINIGNNIIGDKSKIIRLKDIITMEISDMCELNDDGLIGHSYKFVDEILDKPLECRYGYAMTSPDRKSVV